MTEVKTIDPVEQFQNFLKSHKNELGEYKYRQRISQLAVDGVKSLIIDFEDYMTFNSDLALTLIEDPDIHLGYAEEAALRQLRIEDPEYSEELEKIKTRFRRLPHKTALRSMGSEHIGRMVLVDGIVVRATPVKPLLLRAAFRCKRCSTIQYVDQNGSLLTYPDQHSDLACRRRGPFDLIEKDSIFMNSQNMRVQERPEDLPPGQLPRWIDIQILEDMVDVARPGDRVSITGIVRAIQEFMSREDRLRTFNLTLETNFIDIVGKEPEIVHISFDEEERIRELSKEPNIHRRIIRSIAPSVYGYDDIKEAISYLLFGGLPKYFQDRISVRGDLNVLLVGDPGTAKSVLLQYVSKIAPRGLYTVGRGATAAGLTAAVLRERGGGMTLEAGALVLADRGICCIDEIDKMRQEDRVAIHEALAQQTVSIAKGGIVATLNARAAVLAAANPALDRYEPYRSIIENINLPVTILSRFDLIFVIKDQPEKEADTRLAEHILQLHRTGRSPVEPSIEPNLFRKYISYAKQIEPTLTEEAMKRFKDFYLQMRSISETRESPVAITPRQLESLIRLAEARARAGLRSNVTVEDAQAVILIMKKSLGQVGVDMTTGRPDIDLIMTGKPKSVRDRLQVIISVIVEMEKNTGMVRDEDLYEHLEEEYEINRMEGSRLVEILLRDGTVYAPRAGYLKKT